MTFQYKLITLANYFASRLSNASITPYYDTWNLGLWYLELSLLKLCGYSETYYNRIKRGWVGGVEEVP